MRLEYSTIKNYLPSGAKTILDIGCGVAGIDILLYRHYSNSVDTLLLLDKEGISKEIYYDYHGTSAFYNSLAVAKEFLIANGVPPTKIIASDVDADGFPKGNVFDIILSLISWGFSALVPTIPMDSSLGPLYQSSSGSSSVQYRS